LEYWG